MKEADAGVKDVHLRALNTRRKRKGLPPLTAQQAADLQAAFEKEVANAAAKSGHGRPG